MTNIPGDGRTTPDQPIDGPEQPVQYPPPYPPQYQPQYQPQSGYYASGTPVPYAPDHPNATTALVLGIVGMVVCGGLLSPFAWVIGRKAVREIDASQGTLGGRGSAQAGYILGVIGSVMLVLAVVLVVAYLLFFALMFAGMAGYSSGA